MIFSKKVCTSYGTGGAADGFTFLRATLYYSVVQDIANIIFDSGESNPSIINIYAKLKCDNVVENLRKNYLVEYAKPDLIEFYKERSKARGIEFDRHLNDLSRLVESLKSNAEALATKSIRDEFTAHLDLQYTNGTYEYPDISKYNLRWESPGQILSNMKPIIELIGFVVRDASFDWESSEQQNLRMSEGFWRRPSANTASESTE